MFLPRAFVAALAVLALVQAATIALLLNRDRPARQIAVPTCETPGRAPALSDEPCLPVTPSALQA